MVVIEPASGEKENRVNVARKQEARGLEATTTAVAEESSSSKNVTVVTGDASDGFETASESEFNVADDDEHPNQLQEHSEEEQSRPRNDDSLESSVHDDQSRQKALAEANDVKLEGNRLFGDGNYEEALLQYEIALQVAPDMSSSVEMRAACHANRALCFLKVGKYEETIKECRKALELNPNYLKALQRKGEAHEKLEHFEEAIADMKKVLELDPSDVQARRTINHLEPLAAEKREKMKQEMIDKLKEMGNSVLGRFGMSIDNFKAVQDPKTGSYSISFQR